jgi:hypothetical protein
MLKIIYKAIINSPILLFQSVFQPSKAHGFINHTEENKYIYLISFVFIGLFVGMIFAFFLPSHELIDKILFALSFAVAFAFAVAVAVAGAVIAGFFLSIYLPPIFTIIIVLLASISWILIYLEDNGNIDIPFDSEWLFFIGIILFCIAGGMSLTEIKNFQITIIPFSYGISYFLVSQLFFINKNIQFIIKYKTKETQKEGDVTHYIFSKAQKACLIWSPIIALLVYAPVYLNYQPELHVKFNIIAIGFCIIPIIVLHIPDYLICLFIWYYQRLKLMAAVKKKNHRLTQYYENTILFKHEMLYFQLPGLHKIFVNSVKNNAMSIENAIEKIDYLYWLTFQQKQAQKAILALGKDRIIAHEFIHYLIRKKNTPLLKALSQKNRLAGLYLMLFEQLESSVKQKTAYLGFEFCKHTKSL